MFDMSDVSSARPGLDTGGLTRYLLGMSGGVIVQSHDWRKQGVYVSGIYLFFTDFLIQFNILAR